MIFSLVFDSASESMGLFSLAGVFAPIFFTWAGIGVPLVFSHFFLYFASCSLAWHLLFCPYSFWHFIFAERKPQPF
jgi:hypothetical protein